MKSEHMGTSPKAKVGPGNSTVHSPQSLGVGACSVFGSGHRGATSRWDKGSVAEGIGEVREIFGVFALFGNFVENGFRGFQNFQNFQKFQFIGLGGGVFHFAVGSDNIRLV